MLPANSTAPAIGAMIVRARRKIVAHFYAHHAIEPGEAVAYVPDSPIARRQFERMKSAGIIREVRGGRYWFDVAAEQAETERRRRMMVPLVIVVCVLAAALVLFAYRG